MWLTFATPTTLQLDSTGLGIQLVPEEMTARRFYVNNKIPCPSQ